MATINFLYRSVKEESPLIVRLLFRHNNKDYVFGAKTKFNVSKHYWTNQHNVKKTKDIDIRNKQTKVNAELNKIENHILKAFNKTAPALIYQVWLTKQIEYYYNPIEKVKKVPIDLVNFINYYIDKRKNEVRPASITKFNVIKHKMQRLEKELKQQILIKNINENFKDNFVEYYRKENYSQNTTQKELGIIKTFCKYAKARGVETHPELDSLKLKKGEAIKITLSFDELEEIEKLKDLPEHLENAKDWLIISCYLGQRISDFMTFKKELIRTEKEVELIEFTQRKTGKLMTVPLFPKVLEILKKRNGEFPRKFSDQRYNDHIKTVCKLAEINEMIDGKKQINISEKKGLSQIRNVTGVYPKYELITSHIGRRSFATNNYGKIPTTYLIYITGHSTEQMFLNYIGKSNKDLAIEITNYF